MGIYCGFSEAKITPQPESVYLDGYGFRVEPAKGVRDDLYVKVCALKDTEDNRFCIVSLDICGFNGEVSDIIKFHISMKCGIDSKQIALCSIHTHAGPACGVLQDLPLNNDYWNHVGEVAGDCVNSAFGCIKPCGFSSAFGNELASLHNRRGRGFADGSVRVGSFVDTDGNLLGLLARASCHPVIQTSYDISADYPSVLTRLSKEYSVPFVFLQGSCGDVNPYFDAPLTENERIEKLGGELADSVQSVLGSEKSEVCFDGLLSSSFDFVKVPMKEFPSKEELDLSVKETAEKYYASQGRVDKHCLLRLLNYYRGCSEKVSKGVSPDIVVPLQVLKMYDSVFVFLPFEVLTNTALAIEEKLVGLGFKRESVFVIGYSNHVFGYLPPKEEIALGGYEVLSAPTWYDTAFFSEDSEKVVLDSIFKMIVNS